MSRHRFEIEFNVDDYVLKKHDGADAPPPNDVDDWEFSDIIAAAEAGIVKAVDVEIRDYTCLKDAEDE